MSRAEAKALGLKTYFTGKPCCREHVAQRYVAHKECTECSRVRGKAAIAAPRTNARKLKLDALLAGDPYYYTSRPCKNGHTGPRDVKHGKCLECNRKNASRWKLDNPEGVKASRARTKDVVSKRSRAWRLADPERLRVSRHQEYQRHKSAYIAVARERQQKIKVASFAHERSEMNAIYAACPEGHHVDHIVPLKHPLVCGLHCVANLQYLLAAENLRKSNHFEVAA